ncbi:hypothetical protein AKJ50_00765 [candidate division MSBL1 archaeon SCGC-AAA382A13]|uniref:Uncharacterized protein n=1 Tax=candidate division MSBL1 archaeon SCGC-AAA382A13 TaxID=1698279 RepID=A0A133VGD7_9EURY|nr:hypothetical protein AKJ50_00765 [candidate division MSBL1 archaeon SCGC-AAA382A13]
MKIKKNILELIIFALIISSISLLFFQKFEQFVFLLALIVLVFSLSIFLKEIKIKIPPKSRAKKLVIIGIVLAIIDVIFPYLFLKNIESFLGSYLYWTFLTLAVIIIGTWRILQWGE